MSLTQTLALFIACTSFLLIQTNGQKLIGCFVDDYDRDLSEDFYQLLDNSAAACVELCDGFKYASTQFSSQCFCGNSYGKYGAAVNATECNMKCTGNPNEICGGVWRNSVYKVDMSY